MDSAGIPSIARLIADIAAGKPVEVPYLLSAMAGDSFGLLDYPDLPLAHVAGIFMGGMIGQTMFRSGGKSSTRSRITRGDSLLGISTSHTEA